MHQAWTHKHDLQQDMEVAEQHFAKVEPFQEGNRRHYRNIDVAQEPSVSLLTRRLVPAN